eukprot:COSAG01_NODE_1161_length_11459_cov_47.466549_19_plen_70_part_00
MRAELAAAVASAAEVTRRAAREHKHIRCTRRAALSLRATGVVATLSGRELRRRAVGRGARGGAFRGGGK